MNQFVDENARPFEQAVQFAIIQIADTPNVFGCEVEQLDELSFIDLFLAMSPEIVSHISSDGQEVWHEVTEALAFRLVGSASDSRLAYEICAEIAARNAFNGAPLPLSLRGFSALVLSGRYAAPPKARGKPDSAFPTKWALSQMARACATAFDLKLTRGDGAPSVSACDAIVEALQRRGGDLQVTHEALRDWCHHKKYLKHREKMAALQSLLTDQAVHNLGLTRPPQA